ncbi:unnamed protein product [Orchesella dallaii]|uniref:Odorant receptor n=1 Tax=Orchesella dallaii TaxID=48710 RepID=A0ABP1S6Q4_9HEXA
MISPNFLRIVKWRMALMKFSHFTFISWESDTNRMVLKQNRYCIYNSCYLTLYMYAVGAISLYHAFEYISPEPENGESDVFDVDYKPRDEAFSILSGLAHLMYALACMGWAGAMEIVLITRGGEFVDFMNLAISGNLKYQEVYKDHLGRDGYMRRSHNTTDMILLVTAIGSVIIPLIFVNVLFYEFCPEHQIMLRYLEIKIMFEWKFLPMVVTGYYCILQVADLVFIIVVMGMTYLNCYTNWLKLLTPTVVRINNGSAIFTCNLGCTMDEKQVIMVYKEQMVLQERFNNLVGNHYVTAHHSSFLYISAFGLFICIRNWRFIHEPGFLIAPIAPVCCTLTEGVEVKFVEGARKTSANYLKVVAKLAKKHRRQLRGIPKYLKSCRPLQAQLAYPYYQLTPGNFLLFINSIVDTLVSLLVSF